MADDSSADPSAALTPAEEALAALWERHLASEFKTKSATEALSTMAPDAYVNHIPVLTGGAGQDALHEFYAEHFIPKMPPDLEMAPVSRTIGEDQLVEELALRFTHKVEMDWMLPGIAPMGKRVEAPLVAIIRFRGDKLAHEHVYWDQASVLTQLGLIDSTVLPTAGVETARKALDPSLPANELLQRVDPAGQALPTGRGRCWGIAVAPLGWGVEAVARG